jgi:hypothetical protein
VVWFINVYSSHAVMRHWRLLLQGDRLVGHAVCFCGFLVSSLIPLSRFGLQAGLVLLMVREASVPKL